MVFYSNNERVLFNIIVMGFVVCMILIIFVWFQDQNRCEFIITPPPPNQQDPTLNDRILISYGRLELLFELHFLVFIRHYCSCHFRDQVFFMTH